MRARTFTVLPLCLLPLSAQASVWIGAVGYATIADAINAAVPGDVLVLDPGVYNEQVVVDVDDLTIDGGGAATIDWGGSGAAVIDVPSPTLTLAGLTISSVDRRGINGPGANTLTLTDVTFAATTTAFSGGGINLVDAAGLTLTNVLFDGTTASLNGGAISFDASSLAPLTLTDVTFRNTAAGAAGDGGALRVSFADLTCLRCAFEGTSAQDGGAVYDVGSSDLAFVDSTFSGTTASGVGGAIRAASPLSLDGSSFCTPSAGTAGGAIYATAQGGSITNSWFAQGSAPDGGGLRSLGGAWTVTNATFVATTGDALSVSGATSVLTVRNTAITDGTAYGVVFSGGATGNVDYSLYAGNASGNVSGGTIGPNNLTDPPEYTAFTPNGDCTDDQLWPSPTSPLLDAGDPGLLDPDGSRSDIGAYGGPGADPALHADDDGDGTTFLLDCDDADPTSFPGGTEVCDLADNDCNGLVDDDPADLDWWYPDCDGDGQGATGGGVEQCFEPPDYGCPWLSLALVGNDAWMDCDDGDPSVFFGADEYCVLAGDQNCDGDPDQGAVDAIPYFLDADGDGFGSVPDPLCSAAPNHSLSDGDCDDDDPAFYPGAPDPCGDGDDQDCNGADGEPADQQEWFPDTDGDGYGRDAGLGSGTVDCADLSTQGYTDASLALDCDDDAPAVNPDAVEACNLVDDDCNGTVDDVGAPVDWFEDADGDGFGNEAFPSTDDCPPAPGWIPTGLDCDDDDAAVHPDADEQCNGVDDDCDLLLDAADPDASDTFDAFPDQDGDGYGACPGGDPPCAPEPVCADQIGQGWEVSDSDCNDGAADIHPGGDEIRGNTVDEDCDGVAEGLGDGSTDDDRGCNCASAPGAAGLLALAPLALLCRRRR